MIAQTTEIGKVVINVNYAYICFLNPAPLKMFRSISAALNPVQLLCGSFAPTFCKCCCQVWIFLPSVSAAWQWN